MAGVSTCVPFDTARTELTTRARRRALQYTDDETKAVRLVTNEVQVYDPSNFGLGVVDKLRLEGVTTSSVSPGRNPSVALFVGEKKVRSPVQLTLGARTHHTLWHCREPRRRSRFTRSRR